MAWSSISSREKPGMLPGLPLAALNDAYGLFMELFMGVLERIMKSLCIRSSSRSSISLPPPPLAAELPNPVMLELAWLPPLPTPPCWA